MRKICVAVIMGCLCFSAQYLQTREQTVSGITLNDDQNKLFSQYVRQLQDYPDFNRSEKADGIPNWEYGSPSDEKLKQLVEEYKKTFPSDWTGGEEEGVVPYSV